MITIKTSEGACPDHDYDPEWDYDVVEMEDRDREMVEAIGDRVRGEILPVLGFEGCSIFAANLPDQCVAIYISGTAPFPVLGIDCARMLAVCEEEGLAIQTELAVSIAHEIAHGHQEMCGIDLSQHEDETEDAAERFARDWVDIGIIDPRPLEAAGADAP